MDKREILGHLMNAQAALASAQAVLGSLALTLRNETCTCGQGHREVNHHDLCEHGERTDMTVMGGPLHWKCKACGYEFKED